MVLLLPDPSLLLWSGNCQSPDDTPTSRPEYENGPSIGRGHLLQLRLQLTVVIPRQFEYAPPEAAFHEGRRIALHALLRLQLDIEFGRFPQALALRVPASPGRVHQEQPASDSDARQAQPDGPVNQQGLGNVLREGARDRAAGCGQPDARELDVGKQQEPAGHDDGDQDGYVHGGGPRSIAGESPRAIRGTAHLPIPVGLMGPVRLGRIERAGHGFQVVKGIADRDRSIRTDHFNHKEAEKEKQYRISTRHQSNSLAIAAQEQQQ